MKPYAKAILAALIAGLGVLSGGLTDNHISLPEVVAAVSAALVALAGVYAIPNSPDVKHAAGNPDINDGV